MDCQWYHSYKQMNLPEFISQSQQLRYIKNYISSYRLNKITSGDSQKFETSNQDIKSTYTDLH